MLIILRVFCGAAFLYGAKQIAENAEKILEPGDLTNTFWVGYCIVAGILNAAMWVPYIREKISQPITGKEPHHRPHSEMRPDRAVKPVPPPPRAPLTAPLPVPPVPRDPRIRLFDDADQPDGAPEPLAASEVLLRHGIHPGPHRNPEVNLLRMIPDCAAKPDSAPPLPPPAPPSVLRDPRIRLFDAADQPDSA